jgi:hypothetical protein
LSTILLDRARSLPTGNGMTAESVHLLVFAIGAMAGLALLLEIPAIRHRRNQRIVDELRETTHAIQALHATHAVETHRPGQPDESPRPESSDSP